MNGPALGSSCFYHISIMHSHENCHRHDARYIALTPATTVLQARQTQDSQALEDRQRLSLIELQ